MDASERRAWGPLLREARRAQRLSLEAVEEASGVSRRTISDIERQKVVGQEDKLRAIMRTLGIEPEAEDSEVEAFLALLRPLLGRLSADERAEVMPAIVHMVAERLRPRDELADRRERREASGPPPTVADEDLIGLPSVAEPLRDDVEGDTEPLDP
jgi:transcriptional regulator with XRE-family HTH domain